MHIADIANHLCHAFGGWSQVGYQDAARALAGHINNQGMEGPICDLAQAMCEVMDWVEDDPDSPEKVEAIIIATLNALKASCSAPYGAHRSY